MEWIASTPRGRGIYREPNGVGGHRYLSDEVGAGALVWDTCIIDEATLRLCMDIERSRLEAERG